MTPRRSKHGRRILPRGPDTRIRHRRYRVERLPTEVRAVIFRGYSEGDSYEKIRADVEQMGYHVTSQAIGNYWRDIWREEHERLREAHANMALIKKALELDPESPSRQVAEELLYTMVFQAFPLLKKQGPMPLLREAREQQKVRGKEEKGPVKKAGKGAAAEAREVRRRWRKLYGLEEEADGEAEDKEEQEE